MREREGEETEIETDVRGTGMGEDDKKECIKGVLITRYVKSAKDCGRCLSGCQSVCVCVCVCLSH